jgi:hypothetical protein
MVSFMCGISITTKGFHKSKRLPNTIINHSHVFTKKIIRLKFHQKTNLKFKKIRNQVILDGFH